MMPESIVNPEATAQGVLDASFVECHQHRAELGNQIRDFAQGPLCITGRPGQRDS